MVKGGHNVSEAKIFLLELEKEGTARKIRVVRKEGNRNVTNDVTNNVTNEILKGPICRQKIILDMIKESRFITIPEMALKIGFSTRTIKRDIEALIEKGMIRRQGGNRLGYWEILEI